jgi:hypothetical protein
LWFTVDGSPKEMWKRRLQLTSRMLLLCGLAATFFVELNQYLYLGILLGFFGSIRGSLESKVQFEILRFFPAVWGFWFVRESLIHSRDERLVVGSLVCLMLTDLSGYCLGKYLLYKRREHRT